MCIAKKVDRLSMLWRRACWGVLVVAMALQHANAQKCAAPSESKRNQVVNYVIARYKIASKAEVILTDSKQANDACFWLFKYQLSSSQREITTYLSPDGSYLVPALYDMRIDPQLEEVANRERISKLLTTGSSPSLGSASAPVTIVAFSDFQCPYCKRMANILTKELLQDNTVETRILFKFFPLPMHPWATDAAKMAECVSLQKPSEFWKIHDFIFENQQQLTASNVKERIAEFVSSSIEVDQTQYRSCVDNDLALGPVTKDINLGKSLGVSGTPTLFINGVLSRGIKNATQLRALVEEATKTTAKPPSNSPAGSAPAHTGNIASSVIQSSTSHSHVATQCSKESLQ